MKAKDAHKHKGKKAVYSVVCCVCNNVTFHFKKRTETCSAKCQKILDNARKKILDNNWASDSDMVFYQGKYLRVAVSTCRAIDIINGRKEFGYLLYDEKEKICADNQIVVNNQQPLQKADDT